MLAFDPSAAARDRVRAPRPPPVAPSRASLHPLDIVYTRAGLEPPTVDARSRRTQIPQPYRSLLVHQRDMTLTLEAHFGGRVVLRPLSTFTAAPWYYRRVLLAQEYSGRPVEMGAIRMKLAALAAQGPGARSGATQVPLGRILRDGGVDFTSMPREFFAVDAQPRDDGRVLDARAAHALRPPHRSAARRPRRSATSSKCCRWS